MSEYLFNEYSSFEEMNKKAEKEAIINSKKEIFADQKSKLKAKKEIAEKNIKNKDDRETAIKNYDKQLDDVEKQDEEAERESSYKREDVESYVGYDLDVERLKLLREKRKKKDEQAKFYKQKAGSKDPTLDDILTELSVVNEDFKGKEPLRPIHIVITYTGSLFSKVARKVTGDTYMHSSVTFNSDLAECFTYNQQNNGFAIENLNNYTLVDDAKMVIYTVFLRQSEYKIIKNKIKYLSEHITETSYKIINVFKLLINKITEKDSEESLSMICSQFVDALFASIGCDLAGKNTTLVSPQNINDNLRVNKRAYKVYDGYTKDYDCMKIKRIIAKVSKNAVPLKESFNFFDNGFIKEDWIINATFL